MDYAKLLETLLPFLEKLLGAVVAAGHPGVGVSPVMGHLPGLHEELARIREQLVAHKAEEELPKSAAHDWADAAYAKATDKADAAYAKAQDKAP